MAKAKSHKRQHYVPASYLKAWCDSACPPTHEPYVWVFDKDGSDARRRAPQKLFTENDLYTIIAPDGARDLRIEAGLSAIEDRFVRLRNSKFNFQRPLTPEEHVYLCAFVACAQFRTISSRDHHAKQWGNVLKIADDLEARMTRGTPEQRAAAARISAGASSDASLTHAQVRALATKPLQTMMASVLKAIVPVLAKMDMAIFCTADDVGFITSDRPCIWFDPESYKLPPLYRDTGLGSTSVEVTMPISPKMCLYLNWRGLRGYKDAPLILLDEMNRRQRALCHQQYVVRRDATNSHWFYEPPMPDDAWDKIHPGDELGAAWASDGS